MFYSPQLEQKQGQSLPLGSKTDEKVRTRARISAVIPTKNVARIIKPTLESLRFCDEVVIVDMFSTDDTKKACEAYPNVRFLQREDYIYGNFNHGVEQATGDWIIRVDSDEVLSSQLRDSILEVLSDPNPQYLHYDALCHFYYFGMRLHNRDAELGNYWRTILFRKGSARYKVELEHEVLTRVGPAGRLVGQYDHFTTPSISRWLEKNNYYTDKDIERVPLRAPLPRWKILLNTLRYFRGAYFGKGRLYRDGHLGLVVAVMNTFNILLLEMKLWERYEKAKLAEAGLFPEHPNAK